MRFVLFPLLSLGLTLPQFAVAQQTTTSSSQAQSLLQQSFAALTGGQSITDVTLAGTARRIAGSDDETGTATVKALAGTGIRIDLSLPSGNRSELRNTSSAPRKPTPAPYLSLPSPTNGSATRSAAKRRALTSQLSIPARTTTQASIIGRTELHIS